MGKLFIISFWSVRYQNTVHYICTIMSIWNEGPGVTESNRFA